MVILELQESEKPQHLLIPADVFPIDDRHDPTYGLTSPQGQKLLGLVLGIKRMVCQPGHFFLENADGRHPVGIPAV